MHEPPGETAGQWIFMCAYGMHVCTHAHTHTCAHTHTHVHARICTHAHAHTHTHNSSTHSSLQYTLYTV